MALTDDLIFYLKLDESSGNATDEIGSVVLTNTGVTFVAGKINNDARLGTSSGNSNTLLNSTVGAAGLNMANGNAKSISFWFRNNTTNPDTNTNRFIDFRRSSGSSGEFNISYLQVGADYKFTFYVNGGTLAAYTANFTVGTWHYITLTVDASNNIAFYVDGSSVATGTWGSTGTASNWTQIGNANGSTSGGHGGPFDIDEFGCWNRQLSGAEITTLYNSGNGLQYGTAPFIPDLTVSVNDSITVSESVTMMVDLNMDVFDAITVSESVQIDFPIFISVFDDVAISESVTIENTDLGGISVFESVTISESITSVTDIGDIFVFDGITVSESVTAEVNELFMGIAHMRSGSNGYPMAMDDISIL